MESHHRLAFFLICILFIQAAPSLADDRRHERAERRHDRGEHWRGDIRRFHEHELARWHGGHWYHGQHAGRVGWWWIVSGIWYLYPSPVYPYPSPYQPPLADAPAPPEAAATPQYWYYCADPQGYYPYVPQCRVNWQRVPTTPPRRACSPRNTLRHDRSAPEPRTISCGMSCSHIDGRIYTPVAQKNTEDAVRFILLPSSRAAAAGRRCRTGIRWSTLRDRRYFHWRCCPGWRWQWS